MYFIYPFIDVNKEEFAIKIESFLKKEIPYVSGKFYPVEDASIDLADPNNEVEDRYAHNHKYYYEATLASFGGITWAKALKDIHNKAVTKESANDTPKQTENTRISVTKKRLAGIKLKGYTQFTKNEERVSKLEREVNLLKKKIEKKDDQREA